MKTHRPRSATGLLALTGLILLALVLALVLKEAYLGELLVIRINQPARPYPLKLKRNSPLKIEGIVESWGLTYGQKPISVMINVYWTTSKGIKVTDSNQLVSIDPATRKFVATIRVPDPKGPPEASIGLVIFDEIGCRIAPALEPSDDSLIPIIVE